MNHDQPPTRALRSSALALRLSALALLAGAALAATPAPADEGNLYGPAAPEGSAFIRVVNASERDDVAARVGPETISDIPAWSASEFVFLPAGSHSLSVGTQSQPVSLKSGRYYTAVADARGIRVVDNERYDNRLKALVILYNFTSRPGLSLKTSDGRTSLIESVSPDAYGTREVNAAKVTLGVFEGGRRIGETPPLHLVRGRAVSLFVLGDDDAPRLVASVN